MRQTFDELRNGVVLAELGGYGDGPYCAKHGAGAALVMLGTYIVDEADDVPYDPRFVFKPGRRNYAAYLNEHVPAARAGGAGVGVSICTVRLEDTVDFLQAAEEAQADFASYCAHSVMDMFLRANVSSALCRRENWKELRRWAKTIVEAVRIPVIFKIGYHDTPDTIEAVDMITDSGVPIVNINVENTDPGSIGLNGIKRLKGKTPFLIAGGGIKDLQGAKRVLSAGANSVAIGTAAMKDPDFCRRLQDALRNSPSDCVNE